MKKILSLLFGIFFTMFSIAQKSHEFYMQIDSIWIYNCSIENISNSVYKGKAVPKNYVLIMTKIDKNEVLIFKEKSKKDTLYYANFDHGITKYGGVYINIVAWRNNNLSAPPLFKGNFLFTGEKKILVLEAINKDFTILYFLNKTKYKRK